MFVLTKNSLPQWTWKSQYFCGQMTVTSWLHNRPLTGFFIGKMRCYYKSHKREGISFCTSELPPDIEKIHLVLSWLSRVIKKKKITNNGVWTQLTDTDTYTLKIYTNFISGVSTLYAIDFLPVVQNWPSQNRARGGKEGAALWREPPSLKVFFSIISWTKLTSSAAHDGPTSWKPFGPDGLQSPPLYFIY